MKAKKGFTLVEILIVVVILGILAAIVIPQFTDASTEAKEASLKSTLQTVRSQIEFYKIQHNDSFPDSNSLAEFTACLTGYTNQDGTKVAFDAEGALGPYLQAMPKNPWITGATADDVTFVTTDPAAGDSSATAPGWYFNTDTGKFGANDSKVCDDADSTPHAAL